MKEKKYTTTERIKAILIFTILFVFIIVLKEGLFVRSGITTIDFEKPIFLESEKQIYECLVEKMGTHTLRCQSQIKVQNRFRYCAIQLITIPMSPDKEKALLTCIYNGVKNKKECICVKAKDVPSAIQMFSNKRF